MKMRTYAYKVFRVIELYMNSERISRDVEGRFCGSLWSRTKKDWKKRKWIVKCFAVWISVPYLYTGGVALWEDATRELLYVAAPVAHAEEVLEVPSIGTEEMLQRIADCESGLKLADGSAVRGSARQSLT